MVQIEQDFLKNSKHINKKKNSKIVEQRLNTEQSSNHISRGNLTNKSDQEQLPVILQNSSIISQRIQDQKLKLKKILPSPFFQDDRIITNFNNQLQSPTNSNQEHIKVQAFSSTHYATSQELSQPYIKGFQEQNELTYLQKELKSQQENNHQNRNQLSEKQNLTTDLNRSLNSVKNNQSYRKASYNISYLKEQQYQQNKSNNNVKISKKDQALAYILGNQQQVIQANKQNNNMNNNSIGNINNQKQLMTPEQIGISFKEKLILEQKQHASINDLLEKIPTQYYEDYLNQLDTLKEGKASKNNLNIKITSIMNDIGKLLQKQDIKTDQQLFVGFSQIKNYVIQLKQEHPNFFSDQPSGRQEALQLQQWMNQAINNIIQNEQIDSKEKILMTDDLFILVFAEVIRQVSYHCAERGELLLQIFSNYFTLVKKYNYIQEREKLNLMTQNFEYCINQDQQYNELILRNSKKVEETEQMHKNYIKQIEELKFEIQQLNKRENQITKKFDSSVIINNKLKNHIKKQNIEMEQLRQRLLGREIIQSEKKGLAATHQKSLSKSNKMHIHNNSDKMSEQNQQQLVDKQKEVLEALENEENQSDISLNQLINEAQNEINIKDLDNVIVKAYQENPDPVIVYCQETQTESCWFQERNPEMITQTDLRLISSDFNKIMNNDKLKLIIQDEMLKEQIFADQDNQIEEQQQHEYALLQLETRKPRLSKILSGFPEYREINNYQKKSNIQKFIENINIMQKKIQIDDPNENFSPVQQIVNETKIEKLMTKVFQIDSNGQQVTNQSQNKLPNIKKNKKQANTDKRQSKNEIIMQTEDNKQQQQTQKQQLIESKQDENNDQNKAQPVIQRKNSRLSITKIDTIETVQLKRVSMNFSVKQLELLSKFSTGIDKPQKDQDNQELSDSAREKRDSQTSNQKQYKTKKQQQLVTSQQHDEIKEVNEDNIDSDSQASVNQKDNESQSDSEQEANQEDQEVKQQILSIIQLYNLEVEKSTNLRQSLQKLIKIMIDMYDFTIELYEYVRNNILDDNTSTSQIQMERQHDFMQFYAKLTELNSKLPEEIEQRHSKPLENKQNQTKNKEQQKKDTKLKKKQKIIEQRVQRNFIPMKKNFANKMTVQDKMQHSGFVLAQKVKDAGLMKKMTNFYPLKKVLKELSTMYEERLKLIKEKNLSNDIEMNIFVFNRILNSFGFKKVAENKYVQFLVNLMHYQQIFRINMFVKFMGLLNDDKLNYTVDELEKYMQAYDYMNYISTIGNPIHHNDAETKYYVNYLRAIDYIKNNLESIMMQEDVNEVRQYLESIKEIDQKNPQKPLVVDIDMFMSKVLQKYRSICNKTKLFVKNAFFAADLDGNQKITVNEFVALYRHIEWEKFNLNDVVKIFEDNVDVITEQEKSLSFDKFTAICIDFNLFSTEQQDKFIGVKQAKDLDINYYQLQKDWQKEKELIMFKLNELQPYVLSDIIKGWKEILEVIQSRLLNQQTTKDQFRPILIAVKMLKAELERLIEEGKNDEKQIQDEEEEEEALEANNLEQQQQEQEQHMEN